MLRSAGTSRPQFLFDTSRHILTGPDGETIKLRPQSLEVFLLLLENANDVVPKDYIIEAVWKGIAVTDDSVTQCVVDIRRALGNEHRSLLQTIPKIGYRLCLGSNAVSGTVIGPLGFQEAMAKGLPTVERFTTIMEPADSSTEPRPGRGFRGWVLVVCVLGLLTLLIALGLGNWRLDHRIAQDSLPLRGPTLAVLPFDNVGASAELSYFSDGITEDIIALLSRFSELGMVSWSTVSSRSNDDERIREIASEFGVRYLISGSVRHDDERVRVAVRLTDARDGRLLWSERYDERLQDVFLVQDRISSQIVATLAVRLNKIETEFSRSVPTKNIEAYQLSLLGRSEQRKRTREGNLAARERFAEAIALDTSYADAYIRLGETYLEEALFGWAEWPNRSTDKAMVLARTAIELGGANARSLGFLARLHVRTGENNKAQTYLDRAFAFNPNDPTLHEIQGLLYLWTGRADEAIDHLKYVLRYDPDSTLASSHLSYAYYITGRSADAVATIERMIETAPNVLFNHVILTAALVESGDIDSAKAAAAVVRRQHPFLTAEGVSRTEFFSSDEVRQRFMISLRRAGLE